MVNPPRHIFAVVWGEKFGGYLVIAATMEGQSDYIDEKNLKSERWFWIRQNRETWPINPLRCFETAKQAQVEADNLNLWMLQSAINQNEDEMGKRWPNKEVQESGALLPDGLYTMKVVSQEEDESKAGKYVIVDKLRVVEPKQYKGQPFRVGFYIGTDDDPEADEPDTWKASFAASRYKSFLKAADVPETGDIEEESEAVANQNVIVDVGHHEDDSGRKYNDALAFFRVGEQESEAPAPRTAPKAAAKPQGRPKKVVEPVVDDDENDEWED